MDNLGQSTYFSQSFFSFLFVFIQPVKTQENPWTRVLSKKTCLRLTVQTQSRVKGWGSLGLPHVEDILQRIQAPFSQPIFLIQSAVQDKGEQK